MDELTKVGRLAKYKRGEALIRPSDFGDSIFVVRSGMVCTYTIEESGDKNIHLIYGKNDIFPLSRIIGKDISNVYYETMVDCEVLRINADVAVELMHSNAVVSSSVLEQVIKQFMHYSTRVDNLQYKFARERIAYRLLVLARRFGEKDGSTTVMHRFSQEVIGSTTNVSRESVSRELKRFENLGYIKYDPKRLIILNSEALRKELAPVGSPVFIDHAIGHKPSAKQ